MIPTIRHRRGNDWEKITIDGKLFAENHSIDFRPLLRNLEEMGLIKYEYEYNDADPDNDDSGLLDWFDDMGEDK